MIQFRQKYKKKINIINRPITWIILVIISLFILVSALKRYSIALEMSERREEIDKDISSLEERRDSLKAEVNYISSERGRESELRKQFDMARKGEKVVIVLDDEKDEHEEEKIEEEVEVEKRPWYKFW